MYFTTNSEIYRALTRSHLLFPFVFYLFYQKRVENPYIKPERVDAQQWRGNIGSRRQTWRTVGSRSFSVLGTPFSCNQTGTWWSWMRVLLCTELRICDFHWSAARWTSRTEMAGYRLEEWHYQGAPSGGKSEWRNRGSAAENQELLPGSQHLAPGNRSPTGAETKNQWHLCVSVSQWRSHLPGQC